MKVLVINPSSDDVSKSVKVCNTLQKSKNGPFDAVFFLGDVVSEEGTVDGSVEPKSDIYCVEGTRTVKDTGPLRFLGKSGVVTLQNGLVVGYVTGQLDDELVSTDELRGKFEGKHVDLLLTYQWPKVISDEERLSSVGNQKLNCLLEFCQPRYWFAVAKNRFFERQPFALEDRVVRFISLAEQGSKEKQKWFYAFNLAVPAVPEDVSKLQGKLGPVPGKVVEKRGEAVLKRTREDGRQDEHQHDDRESKRPRKVVNPQSCFFCLSNPQVELHMIVSIGKYSYLTIAKGPLTTKRTPLGFAGHGLIIPINHCATLRQYRDTEEPEVPVQDTKVFQEIAQYKDSALKMFDSFGDYSVVYWEFSLSSGVHFHVQFVPVLTSKLGLFEQCLVDQIKYTENRYHGRKMSYRKLVSGNDDDDGTLWEIMNKEDYMLITVAKSTSEKTNYLFEASKGLDLQFPRKVMAKLMNLNKRMRWDRCKGTISDEGQERDTFREKFKPYDFTL